MTTDSWQWILVGALAANAAVGLGYRVFRLTRGGPVADVVGQALLAVVLSGVALAVAAGIGWARWVALGYGLLFALVVMPVWILAVLIPLRPGPVDLSFTGIYYSGLVVAVVAALLL